MNFPRFKVWKAVGADTGELLLRTGLSPEACDWNGDFDVEFAGYSAIEVAKAACVSRNYSGRVFVKDFDMNQWSTVDVTTDGESTSFFDGKVPKR